MGAFEQAKKDPRWQDAHRRYLRDAVEFAGENANQRLGARLTAVDDMAAIEAEYERREILGADATECRDASMTVYPEHDYPPEDEGNECRRCGAEADTVEEATESAEAGEDEFSDAVRRKARKLITNGRVRRDGEYGGVWWVGSETSETKSEYRVELNDAGFQSCSCKHGLNKGGGSARCSHVLAATLVSRYRL